MSAEAIGKNGKHCQGRARISVRHVGFALMPFEEVNGRNRNLGGVCERYVFA